MKLCQPWFGLLAVLLWLTAAPARAQTPALDSLRHLAANPAAPDTARVTALDELCWQLGGTDVAAATRYGLQGLALARRCGYRLGEGRCLNDLGTCAGYAGTYEQGLRWYFAALPIFRQLRRVKLEGYAYNGLANMHNRLGNAAVAFGFYGRALALAEARRDVADVALFRTNLTELYRTQRRYPQAMRLGRAAWAAYQQLGDSTMQVKALSNLALVTDQAGRPAQAALLYRQALALARAQRLPVDEAKLCTNYSDLLTQQNRPAEALALARQALAAARRAGTAEEAAAATEALALALAKGHDYRAAYLAHRRYLALLDSQRTLTNAQATAQMQARYETREKEAALRVLRQRQRIGALQADQQTARLRLLGTLAGGLALVLLGGGWFGWQLRRSRATLAERNAALEATTAELQTATAAKDRLYALIGHDLRGPVVSFGAQLRLLGRHLQQGNAARLPGLLAQAGQAAGTLRGLLDNLLHWAAAHSGDLAPHPEPLPVAELLADTHALLAEAAAEADLTLLVQPAPPGLRLPADRRMVLAQLRNLTANAVQATPAGGCVSLSALAEGNTLTLWVQDTGPGLPAAHAATLRGLPLPAGAPAAPVRGTGLGLRLVRLFAEQQGATVLVEYPPEGGTRVGLVFAIKVPE